MLSTLAGYDSVSTSLLSKLNKLLRLLSSLQEKLLTLEEDLKTTTINPADYQSYTFFQQFYVVLLPIHNVK